MSEREMMFILTKRLGIKLRLKDVLKDKYIYKAIFYNSINKNLCIYEYLESLGFILINKDEWRVNTKVSFKEYSKKIKSLHRERNLEKNNLSVVNRSWQYNSNGTRY